MRAISLSSSGRIQQHTAWVVAASAIVAVLLWSRPPLRAADTLPTQLTDGAFWKLIDDLSEPGGVFQSENFLSNETGFQAVIPRLVQTARPDGAYMGVGPEQNFTYIAAIRPKIAFIVDIRHQNMLEHMMYKALFELSPTRVDFIARLFGRQRPSGLDDRSTVDELFSAYARMPNDEDAFKNGTRSEEFIGTGKDAYKRGFPQPSVEFAELA